MTEFNLDEQLDEIERAACTLSYFNRPLLRDELRAARERIREEFQKLRERYIITGEKIPYCDDCGIRYGVNGWCDVVIPDAIWNQIAPEGGVLCFMCMTFRINKAGLKDVPVIIASGPYKDANEEWRLAGWDHGHEVGKDEAAAEIAKLRRQIQECEGRIIGNYGIANEKRVEYLRRIQILEAQIQARDKRLRGMIGEFEIARRMGGEHANTSDVIVLLTSLLSAESAKD